MPDARTELHWYATGGDSIGYTASFRVEPAHPRLKGRCAQVEVWAGDEMDSFRMTSAEARKAAEEWPVILRAFADEADRLDKQQKAGE